MNLIKKQSSIKLILLHLIFWVVVWFFFNYFFGFSTRNEDYVFWFSNVLMPITISNTYFFIYYLIPKYLLPKKYKLFILYGVYTLITTAYLLSSAMFFGYVFLSELDFKKMPPLSTSLPFILMSIYLIVIVVSSFKLLKNNYLTLEKNKTLENKFLLAQLQLKEEELKFLKMQIHPHFLFNTLNTLYGFALKKADETPEMILKLSNLLDYILYQIDKPKVLLTEELNHIKDYIDLEKIRFHETLLIKLNIDIKEDLCQIAPMLLMPFVENSFKHGNLIDGILKIDIDVIFNNNLLEFTVSNSFIENNEINIGIGLENIKKRLEILYSNQYNLQVQQLDNIYTIKLKLKTNA